MTNGVANGEAIRVEEYMSAGDAAAFLGISKTTMRKLLRTGVLKYVPDEVDSRFKMIRRADVEALARRSLRNPPKTDPQAA